MYSRLPPSVRAFPKAVARAVFNTWQISGTIGCSKLRQLGSNIWHTSLPIFEQNHRGISRGFVMVIQLDALRASNVDILVEAELFPGLDKLL